MDDGAVTITVQLVDDQTLVRKALATLLQTTPNVQVVATSGSVEEAIRHAVELQPHLLLMDVLPEATIFEGAAEIIRRCPNTKLIFLDDAPRDANARESLRIQAAGYLTKQQPYSQIETAMRQAIRGERVFAPEIARRLVFSTEGVRLPIESAQHPWAKLTPRESDVLIHLAQGCSVKQCAEILGIGISTVGNHKSRLMKKLDVHKTVELTRLAIREGLLPDGRPAPAPRARDLEASR